MKQSSGSPRRVIDDLNAWVAAGRSVARGIRYTRSIDSYIYTHRDAEKIKDCAKLAIVQSILDSERHSALFVAPNGNWTNEDKVVNASWLQVMMYLLQDKIVRADNFGDIFKNFTIINFNYDRCVEYFLFHALQHLYLIRENEAADTLNRWNRIFHPYGTVGALPWQKGARTISFGGAGYSDIWGLSQEIFTYNEQISEGQSLAEIRNAIVSAQRIVFLGFHFHQQNMDLLQTAVAGGMVRVLLSDSGALIGVTSGGGEGEGLNIAVSVDNVRRFLVEPAKPPAQTSANSCEPKEMSRFRNKENNAAVISYDMSCSGNANANYIVPDRTTDAIILTWDRNGDGHPDVVFFDFKRRGRWDLSFWDTLFVGRWTLVGYHDDGSLKPTRFERYEDFQKRLAAQN